MARTNADLNRLRMNAEVHGPDSTDQERLRGIAIGLAVCGRSPPPDHVYRGSNPCLPAKLFRKHTRPYSYEREFGTKPFRQILKVASSVPASRPPYGCVHRWAPVAYGRTRMIVFPLIRLVGLKAATASSRVETLPMFVRSRPSRTRWTISLSWARSDSTTKSTPGRRRAAPRAARRWTPVFLRLESGLRTASRCRRR